MRRSLSVLTGEEEMRLHTGDVTPGSESEALRREVLLLGNVTHTYVSAIHKYLICVVLLCVNEVVYVWNKHCIHTWNLSIINNFHFSRVVLFSSSLLVAWFTGGQHEFSLFKEYFCIHKTDSSGFCTRVKEFQFIEAKMWEQWTSRVCENETPLKTVSVGDVGVSRLRAFCSLFHLVSG